MDNITNTLFFIERIQAQPDTPENIYKMQYFNIISIINNINFQGLFYMDNNKFNIIINDNNIDFIPGSDFRFNIKKSFVLKNDNALQFLNQFHFRSDYSIILKQTLLPIDIFNYYVINFYNEETNVSYFITVISINIISISSDFYHTFNDKIKNTTDINNKFFIQYLLTLMKYHFEEVNNISNKSCENMEILKRINCNTNNYLEQKMIDQPHFLNNQLYYYQKANIYWMINRENNKNLFILNDNVIVNWGPDFQFDFSILSFTKQQHIQTLTKDEFNILNKTQKINKFNGGCLCDDVGLGKTIQILTLCFLFPSKNIIIVPDHLKEHWLFEYNKHFNNIHNFKLFTNFDINYDETILITFSDYSKNYININKQKWTRVIVDEFHEIISKKIYDHIISINTKYKWAVTATPFINSNMIFSILNFIAQHQINNNKIAKYKKYLDIFTNMFRRNTKHSITSEINLPKINEFAYYLNFSDKESLFYKTIVHKDVPTQLKFCINPNIFIHETNFQYDQNFISINQLDDSVLNIHKTDYHNKINEIFQTKKSILIEFNFIIKSVSITQDEIDAKWEIFSKTNKFHTKQHIIDKLYKQLAVIESSMKYFEQQIQIINKKIKSCGTLTISDDTKPAIIDDAKPTIIDDAKPTIIDDAKPAIIDHAKHEVIDDAKPTIIDDTKPTIIDDAKPTIIDHAKHEVIDDAKPTIIDDTKPTIIDDAKPAIIDHAKHEVIDESKPAIIDDKLQEYKELSTECSICMDNITQFSSILQCGHYFHTYCLNELIKNGYNKCPMCKISLKNTIIYQSQIKSKSTINNIELYGTKIAHLINIIKTSLVGQKIILYCHSENLLKNISKILQENQISNNNFDQISQFEKNDIQVLILSSNNNASGLNLTFVSTIILLQNIDGDYIYRKQIENQMVGRLHRIGQQNEIKFIRLIINNTIEHKMEIENLTQEDSCNLKIQSSLTEIK